MGAAVAERLPWRVRCAWGLSRRDGAAEPAVHPEVRRRRSTGRKTVCEGVAADNIRKEGACGGLRSAPHKYAERRCRQICRQEPGAAV